MSSNPLKGTTLRRLALYSGDVHIYHMDFQCHPYDDKYTQVSAPAEEHVEWAYETGLLKQSQDLA